jgi:hypothetical protein
MTEKLGNDLHHNLYSFCIFKSVIYTQYQTIRRSTCNIHGFNRLNQMRCFDFDYTCHMEICGFEACNSSRPGLLNALPVELYDGAISCFDIYYILTPLLLLLLHNTHKKSFRFKYKSDLHPCGFFYWKIYT